MYKIAALAMALVAAVAAAGTEPRGTYCGEYMMGLVRGKAAVHPETRTFDLNLNALGSDIQCPGIHYDFNAATGAIIPGGATDPATCLGGVASKYGINSITMKYTAGADSVYFNANGVAELTLTQC
jgi:hypothetical protein